MNIRHTVAIGSCKGGVGKTTTAVNLALALRRLGLDVGLFDADLYGPNIPLMFGQKRERSSGPMSFSKRGKKSVGFIPITRAESEPYIEPSNHFGLKIMSLGLWFGKNEAVRDGGMIGAHMMKQTLHDVLWGNLDMLVIDLPPGTGEPQQTFLKTTKMDGVVVVTTTDAVAQADAVRSVKLFGNLNIRVLGTVENMSTVTCPKCGSIVPLMNRETELWDEFENLSPLGRIPFDPALGKPIGTDHPLTFADLDSPIAKDLISLARRVLAVLGEDESNTGA